jgi:pimeloyl-ACP methyl ester carboxylesterase
LIQLRMLKLIKQWLMPLKQENDKTFYEALSVVWIHGANQSGLSFQYLRSLTRFKNELVVEYDTANKFYNNLEMLSDEIKKFRGPYFIVGHSLGGLYALHLTQHVEIAGAVSISTPFAGSWTADWARFFVPTYQLFREVGRRSIPIRESQGIKLKVDWTQIVSTKGNVPYHGGQNDGVCTIKSMKSRKDMELIEVPHTHFEVMCSDLVAEIILERYLKICREQTK